MSKSRSPHAEELVQAVESICQELAVEGSLRALSGEEKAEAIYADIEQKVQLRVKAAIMRSVTKRAIMALIDEQAKLAMMGPARN